MAKKPAYLVGIDLGTTHTVVAYAELTGDLRKIVPSLFTIEQLVGPGIVARRPYLPSLRYHPAADEIPAAERTLGFAQTALPGELETVVFGDYARVLGSKSASRLVVSAKSWLSHDGVDRTDNILPWGSDDSIEKVSPVLASASYLGYVRDAWNAEFSHAPLEQQEIVITIPASFDEAARSLTLEAAALAGLHEVLLIEEPQAVCYDWFLRHRDQAQAKLAQQRLLLVCDIGGGTTDFSLIKIGVENGQLALQRVGVGDHLMLGGDNLDLALAKQVQTAWQLPRMPLADLAQLIQQARTAKEALLQPDAPDQANVTLLGAGSTLVGGARRASLAREDTRTLLLEGFFPLVEPQELPRKRRQGVVEIGLPYAADPAVTRHIAEFLQGHQSVCREAFSSPDVEQFVAPDTVLFNGGMFNSPLIQERVLAQLQQWRPTGVTALDNGHPDQAVAFGAVAYGLARRGAQVRIAGGAARSYFLAVDSDQGPQGVCLLPRGTPEGAEMQVEARRFSLRVGEPVQFHLAATTDDARYDVGDIVPLDAERFRRLPPLVSTLPRESREKEVEVHLLCWLTDIGTVQLACVGAEGQQHRWLVEFEIRQHLKQMRAEGGLQFINAADLPPRFAQAADWVRQYYGSSRRSVDPDTVRKLRGHLEKLLGRRDNWDSVVLRALSNEALGGLRKRRRSLHHERVWLNLTGFCLRPGYGFAGDPWRIRQLWPIYRQGLQFPGENQSWTEWWTLWRRVAGGLSAQQQSVLFQDVWPYLEYDAVDSRKRQAEARLRSYDDMLRLAAVLEHISVKDKIALGDAIVQRLQRRQEPVATWWALGRLGARAPLYGDPHHVVPTSKVYEWLEGVWQEDWKANPHAAFCAVMLGRVSGDPARDLDERVRERMLTKLRQSKVPQTWRDVVESAVALEGADLKRLHGESLPVGLKLVR